MAQAAAAPAAVPPHQALSAREFDVLRLLLQGQTVIWMLAASQVLQSVAMLILSIKIRAGSRR